MGCPCRDKMPPDVAPAFASPETEQWVPNRFLINCKGCGLNRMLPKGIKEGDSFELVPCPKCATPFKGIFQVDQVEEVI